MLLIVLAQFGVVVHAADHLFHAEELLCAAYNSAEHDKSLQQSSSAVITASVVYIDGVVYTDSIQPISCSADYLSRAPPQITI